MMNKYENDKFEKFVNGGIDQETKELVVGLGAFAAFGLVSFCLGKSLSRSKNYVNGYRDCVSDICDRVVEK